MVILIFFIFFLIISQFQLAFLFRIHFITDKELKVLKGKSLYYVYNWIMRPWAKFLMLFYKVET